MYNPCFECQNRYGHSYTEECDGACNYAYDVRMLKSYKNTGLSPEEFKESVDFVLNLNAKLHNVAKDLIKEYENKYEYYDTDSYWNNGAIEVLEELLRRLHKE